MNKLITHFSFLLLCISISITSTFAQNTSLDKLLPEVPTPPHLVNDFAGMLSQEEIIKLENKLLQYEQKTSNEIAIVTIESLQGHAVEEFAVALGRKWDIGKASKKNGVLILASKLDKKINISPAYGLSGVLPDITCGRIIREQIVPNFKNEKYYQGFDEAADAMFKYIANEFTSEPIEGQSSVIDFFVLLFIVLFFMLILFIIFYAQRNSKTTYVSRRGWINQDDTWHGGGFGGGSSWGGGSSSGGGFGGFGGGGGGFDGGGASGSW